MAAAMHRNGDDDVTVVIADAHAFFVRQALQDVAADDICEPDLPASIEELDRWIGVLTRLRADLTQLGLDAENIPFTESRELLVRVADTLTQPITTEDPEEYPADAAAAALARAIGREMRKQLGEEVDA